jgi:membrane protein
VSILIITLLFASVLRFLPDAQVDWSDVWIGAVTTSVLFWLGQFVLGLYFGWSHPTSAYGAAGSLALVLLWIYYSAMILFLGAEFTHVMAERRGKFVPPEPGARKGTAHCASASLTDKNRSDRGERDTTRSASQSELSGPLKNRGARR